MDKTKPRPQTIKKSMTNMGGKVAVGGTDEHGGGNAAGARGVEVLDDGSRVSSSRAVSELLTGTPSPRDQHVGAVRAQQDHHVGEVRAQQVEQEVQEQVGVDRKRRN